MKRLSLAFLPLLLILLMTSCRKNPIKNLTVEESWVYISSGNNGINFSNFSSVTVPDSVILISNRQGSNN